MAVTHPSVSVVIPAYNCATSLPQAIQSVRDQCWKNLEVVVVNDGSTDETEEVLQELEGPDLHVIRSANAGPAAARNLGIRAAGNEWIAFLDADDFWLPGKLAMQFQAIRKTQGAQFSFTDFVLRKPDGSEQEQRCWDGRETLLETLLHGNVFATLTVLVHRSCFDEVGRFDESLRSGEDWDMWLRLASRYPFAYVRRPAAVVRAPEPGKYQVNLLEYASHTVLKRFFDLPSSAAEHLPPGCHRRTVYAWHYAVLAKSYATRRQFGSALRTALQAASFHPRGLSFLLPGAAEKRFAGRKHPSAADSSLDFPVTGFYEERSTD